MWKRFQSHGREKERQPQIGNPVLLETTYDEDQLRRNLNVADVQYANHASHARTSIAQHYSSSPRDPPNYRAAEASPDWRASLAPTPSSIYSRPSNDLAHHHYQDANHPPAYEGVSPPSSPEPERYQSANPDQPRRFKSMRDVSPMDENRGKGGNSPRASNIPVLRKAPPSVQPGQTQPAQAQKFWGGKVAPDGKVRWDEYSGEPTAGNAGRTGSVSPGSYAKDVAQSTRQPMTMGYHVSVSGPRKKNVSFSERVGRMSPRPPPLETTEHEPWSRASGRSQIAPPLKDQRAIGSLKLPRKTLSPTPERSNANAPNLLAVSRSRGVGRADTGSVASIPHDLDTHDDLIKPTVPLKVGRNTLPLGIASPVSPINLQGLGIHGYPSPLTPTSRQRTDSPDTVIHEQRLAKEIPALQRIDTPPQDPVVKKATDQTPEKDRETSTSRFSWTTYNSTTTYQHSPPPSPPNLPTQIHRARVVTDPLPATSAASSILSRRRPVPQANRIGKTMPSPKPVSTKSPGTAKVHPTTSSPTSPSSASTYSTTKALPLPPTSLLASTHTAVLESALEDLRIRRSNVYRLLSDLKTAAPPNPLVTDFKRARLVEGRKRVFEDELAEIKREEYEVGIKLHRAWRKRDREEGREKGSAIWVSRVTS
ncbi:hypothetical protein BDU57DRAFT_435809 [Ampelomyces quisqualis]|uniref:Uncharacterized protein n=1 Tax=Ampelomyces quisqualis TaxID=50730 RepID=A0A6A5QYF7_AMPQU|nr:hypothetical protein BDU57DRAFT_435809 [Ampelomyces quisqualis]